MSDAARKKSSRLRSIVKWALCLIVLLFVYRSMRDRIAQIDWSESSFHPWMAIATGLCLMGMAVLRGIVFRLLLAAYHRPLPWSIMAGIAWIPQLGKYIPGKVASLAGAMWILRQNNVPGAAAFSAISLVGGFAMMTSFMLSTPLLVWHPGVREAFPSGMYLAIAGVGGFLFCMHPAVFGTVMNVLMRKLKRQPLEMLPRARQYLGPLLATFGQWIFAGLGLWCAAGIVTEVEVRWIPLFVSTAALGMTLGYLALFAPAGIGVREYVFMVVLGGVVGPKIALAAIVVRIIHTVVDLLMAGIGASLMRTGARSNNSPISPAPPPGAIAE